MKVYCGFEWKAPRTMVNARTQESFETLPVNHFCGVEGIDNHEIHICSCGETTKEKA